MSFLTKLRQNNTQSHSLKLGYILEIDAKTQSLLLQLILLDVHDGRILNEQGTPKPYQLQRQHIQSPPPFIPEEDISFLKYLIEQDSTWLDSSQGVLNHYQSLDFLHDIVCHQRAFAVNNEQIKRIQFSHEKPVSVDWHTTTSGEQQLHWKAPPLNQIFFLGTPCLWNSKECTLSKATHPYCSDALAALRQFNTTLAANEVHAFLSAHQEKWQQWSLPLPKLINTKTVSANLIPILRLITKNSRGKTKDYLQLEFRYCNDTFCGNISPSNKDSQVSYFDKDVIHRMSRLHAIETDWVNKIACTLDNVFEKENTYLWHSAHAEHWKMLLATQRDELSKAGFVFVIEKGFRHHYVTTDHWHVELQNQDDNWQLKIELAADNKSINIINLLKQLQSVNILDDNQYCLSMDDGRFLLLPKEQASGLMEELGDLAISDTGCYQLPTSQISRLSPLQDMLPDNTHWQGDIELLEHSSSIHQQPQNLPRLVDSDFNLKAQLRPYQRLGAFWLQHLKQHQINGLLADDMGLGKTLQTLAHLCFEKQLGNLQQPALIVMPTSLLHNWATEIQRFAPTLDVTIMHGPQRHQTWGRLDQYDVIITSYSLIAKDLAQWQQQPLSWVILDEAQMIKNRQTQISEAIRQLDSENRLCLSGTPVENHLGELWSIFDFLMPNCLGSYKQFNDYFRTPIEKKANAYRFEQLLKRIAPFMLRRTKEQVATDLPPKTQIYQSITMGDQQRQFYEQLKNQTREDIEKQSSLLTGNAEQTSGQKHIQVLTALLKLRQACCDPLLLNEQTVASAKKDHCIEMICELVEEKRSILVFSQFTSMLDILASALDQHNIAYLKLTGSTQNRQQMVENFQAGITPVFLISLKAGGVGLNLTRADTVIHYDPWWNSAAEQQASDRAHRIGQDKPVFVYKLIIEDSIEEKIAQLQQRKSILSQDVSTQAQLSGEQFAYKLEDLLTLWDD